VGLTGDAELAGSAGLTGGAGGTSDGVPLRGASASALVSASSGLGAGERGAGATAGRSGRASLGFRHIHLTIYKRDQREDIE
jgi:hypothetical protein